MQCAQCDSDNPAGARFCGACGASLALPCPRCGVAVAEGLRFCTACGQSLGPAPPPANDTGERRLATVMFSDLSGYTALTECTDPEEVEALMNRIKLAAIDVVEGHGGSVNQFVGDEVMALFGLPLAHGDDPVRAVRAARELHAKVDVLVADRAGSGPLALHTGIATGLVVARRSDGRAGDFVLTGDAVNTAARLRGLAAPGEIVVGSETWQQVSAYFETEAREPVTVKGKDRPLAAYRICAERSSPIALALVGRDEELHDFRVMAHACLERRRSRVIVVRGDPGIGKTRLISEFGVSATRLGFRTHAATVLDFGAETGRDAVRSLALSLIGLADRADEASRQKAAEVSSTRQPLAQEGQLFLHDLIGLVPPPSLRALATAMSVAAREKGSIQALCELARLAAAEAPLLLVVEDIHWADSWTLERLAALSSLAAREPMLLVLTTRFAGDPTAGVWRTALHGAPLLILDLAPLGEVDALSLAAALTVAPAEKVRPCVARAAGNPLFLSQLLLNVDAHDSTELPGSIQALVHSRMDRLAPDAKAALQAAAVLGQRYSLDVLRHLLDDATCSCHTLAENFLVRAEGTDFHFCHALIRDGAYASLLHSRRRQLHARAAEWFADRDPALAAEHFDRAGDDRAPRAYLSASAALAAHSRYGSALPLVDRGLELSDGRPDRFALLMARAGLLVALGRTAEATAACQAALAAADSGGDRARALIELAAAMRINDHIDDGLAALAEAEPLAREAGLALERSRLHHLRGNLLFPLGRADECVREHQSALDCADEAGSLEARATALGGLGDAYYLEGRMLSAHEQFERCVALAREHGFGRLEVAVLQMVGWTRLHLLNLSGAMEVATAAAALAVQASQPRAELLARLSLGWVDGMMRGHIEPARAQLDTALGLATALEAKRFASQIWGCRAVLALQAGERDAANEAIRTALDLSRAQGMGHIGPWLRGIEARLAPDAMARKRALAQGEAALAGSVSHNHIFLRDMAIETALESRDWDAADSWADRLEHYTAAEPLPTSQFLIGRGRALARFGRGERSAGLRAELMELDARARAAEMNVARVALDAALGGFAAEPAAPATP